MSKFDPEFSPWKFTVQRSYSNESGLLRRRLKADRMLRIGSHSSNVYKKDLKSHFGCVNAIEFSNGGGKWIASGGDDRRVLLWDVEKSLSDIGSPTVMTGHHHSNIFCLAFDNNNEKIYSGGNDQIVIVHDLKSGQSVDVFQHDDAVYGLTVDPLNSNVFASACDDGRVIVYDIRQPPSEEPYILANYTKPMHAVMYNPVDSRLLATANAENGIALWDIRKPRSCLLNYGGVHSQQSCMSVRFSSDGRRLLALRRRMPPVLYDIKSTEPLVQFHDDKYFNSCTMKSCAFAGENDEYVLSGSDDFRLYMWKIPDEGDSATWVRKPHCVFEGHRSIVNQVRYNPDNCLVISSGVEKIIKVWSPFNIEGSQNEKEAHSRPAFTHAEYIDLMMLDGQFMTHDYSSQSTEEDPRMMAFFDSLVQREKEGANLYAQMGLTTGDMRDIFDTDTDSSQTVSDTEAIYSPFSRAFAAVVRQARSHGNVDDLSSSGSDEWAVSLGRTPTNTNITEFNVTDDESAPDDSFSSARMTGIPSLEDSDIVDSCTGLDEQEDASGADGDGERIRKKRKHNGDAGRHSPVNKRKRVLMFDSSSSSSSSSSTSSDSNDNDRSSPINNRKQTFSSVSEVSLSSDESCGNKTEQKKRHQIVLARRWINLRKWDSGSSSGNETSEMNGRTRNSETVAANTSAIDSVLEIENGRNGRTVDVDIPSSIVNNGSEKIANEGPLCSSKSSLDTNHCDSTDPASTCDSVGEAPGTTNYRDSSPTSSSNLQDNVSGVNGTVVSNGTKETFKRIKNRDRLGQRKYRNSNNGPDEPNA